MSLRINLYHEIQKQQKARRRDPLKLAMFGLAFIGICFVAYYLYRLGAVHEVNSQAAVIEENWSKMEPKQKAAKTREDELTANIKLCDDLVRRIEGRFFWAPILEELLHSVPPDVQLTHLDGTLNPSIHGRALLNVGGLSSTSEPRKVAEDFRTALDEKLGETFKQVDSHFNLLDDAETSVALNGQSFPVANFAIEFQLLNSVPEAPASTPTRRKVAAQ